MNADAFVAQTRTLTPTLFRIGMSILHHEADAQDAMQQALERAWTHRDKVRDGSFRPWLMKIFVNECRNIQRHHKRVLVTDILSDPGIPAHDMSLHDALSRLPEKIRTPFLLKYMERFTEKEIATMLRIPQSTVRGRLSRARKKLQAELTEKEAGEA